MSSDTYLYLIAGAPGAGKSYLIAKIRSGLYNELALRLNIRSPETCHYCSLRELSFFDHNFPDRLIIHVDLYALFSKDNAFDNLMNMIDQFTHIGVITVTAHKNCILFRLTVRFAKLISGFIFSCHRNLHFRSRRLLIKIIYLAGKNNLSTLYANWDILIRKYSLLFNIHYNSDSMVINKVFQLFHL